MQTTLASPTHNHKTHDIGILQMRVVYLGGILRLQSFCHIELELLVELVEGLLF
jgi:hypothetical protein